jgi:uncharacterized protein
MRPGDHPDFYRLPAPEGRSRESTIVLDREGRFWHDGRLVEHAGLGAALHSWIARHPLDGRYILTNGYDWTYFTVEGAPYTVRALRPEPDRVILLLSDGTEESWDPESTRTGDDGALYASVKATPHAGAAGPTRGPFEARFSRHAQTSLGPLLVEGEVPAIRIAGRVHAIGAKAPGIR